MRPQALTPPPLAPRSQQLREKVPNSTRALPPRPKNCSRRDEGPKGTQGTGLSLPLRHESSTGPTSEPSSLSMSSSSTREFTSSCEPMLLSERMEALRESREQQRLSQEQAKLLLEQSNRTEAALLATTNLLKMAHLSAPQQPPQRLFKALELFRGSNRNMLSYTISPNLPRMKEHNSGSIYFHYKLAT